MIEATATPAATELTSASDSARYYLPLGFRDRVKQLSLRVEVVKATARPIISKGGPRGLSFRSWSNSYVAQAKLKNKTLTNDLYVQISQAAGQGRRVAYAG